MLANVVSLDMDGKLSALANQYDCVYTRYADDITFSGKKSIPDKIEISKILSECGFELNEQKFYVSVPGQSHYVTGLSVSDGRGPRAPRRMKRRLRQELYYSRKYGIIDHIDHIDRFQDWPEYTPQMHVNRIDGFVRYVSHIEKEFWPKLKENWEELLKRDDCGPNYATVPGQTPRFIALYLDESQIAYLNKQYMAVAIAQTEDPKTVRHSTLTILRSYLADPFAEARTTKLEKKGLHYTDANEDLRKKYVEKLSTLPIKAYVAYGELKSPDNYENLYFQLVSALMRDRLMGCDGAFVSVFVEQNSQVGAQKLESTIKTLFDNLSVANNRRPQKMTVTVGSKDEFPGFSVPDFMLGVFGGYSTAVVRENAGRVAMFFERLRDKYRVILDADRGIVYSRKRPYVPWGKLQ